MPRPASRWALTLLHLVAARTAYLVDLLPGWRIQIQLGGRFVRLLTPDRQGRVDVCMLSLELVDMVPPLRYASVEDLAAALRDTLAVPTLPTGATTPCRPPVP